MYGAAYRRERATVLGLPCEMQLVCDGDPADSADHVPPLSRHTHIPGSGCCVLRPACLPCQHKQAITLANETRARRRMGLGDAVIEPEPVLDVVTGEVEWL